MQNSLCVQVLRSSILAALMHGTGAAGVNQALWCGTSNGITELLQRVPPILDRAAITLGIDPHKLRPISGSHRFTSLGYSSKFQRVSRVGFLTVLMSLNGRQPNFVRCLAVSWAGTLCICFWGLLPPNRILQDAKLTLRPSLAFSYIGSVNARHWSSGRQPNFVVWYK